MPKRRPWKHAPRWRTLDQGGDWLARNSLPMPFYTTPKPLLNRPPPFSRCGSNRRVQPWRKDLPVLPPLCNSQTLFEGSPQ